MEKSNAILFKNVNFQFNDAQLCQYRTVVTTVSAVRTNMYFIKRISVYRFVETILTSNVNLRHNKQNYQFQSYLNEYSILFILAMSDKIHEFFSKQKTTVYTHFSCMQAELTQNVFILQIQPKNL